MNKISALGRVITLGSIVTAAAHAAVLFDITSSLQLTDPVQLGRLSRNSIQQDWVGSEPFPGVVNPTTPYHYTTYSVNVGVSNFVQIDFDDVAGLAQTFVSAYQTSYSPLSFSTNWLGDPGLSGNLFGNPLFFNVVAAKNSNLIVVVNNTLGVNLGVGDQYHLTVEGFVDTDFTDAPEPSAEFLCVGGLAALAGRRIWRRI